MFSHFHKADALLAHRVLIYGYHFLVGEDLAGLEVHLTEVVAAHEGRRHHAPHGEVGLVLIFREFSVTNLQHFHVVPVAGTGVGIEFGGGINALKDANPAPVEGAIEAGADVGGDSPKVADSLSPLPGLVLSPFADAEDDGTAGGLDGLRHSLVGCLGILAVI